MKTRFGLTLMMILAAGLLISCNTKTTGPSETEPPPNAATATMSANPAATNLPAATSVPEAATPVPDSGSAVESVAATPAGEPTQLPEQATPTEAEPVEASPTEEAGSAPPESPPAEGEAACTDVAAFISDVTVEDYTLFRQNESFVKTWRVKNAGTCSWGPGYTINFDSGFTFNAAQSSSLPEAEPGQSVDISLPMAAPARGGQYISRWRFKNPAGTVFGVGLEHGQLFTVINVGFIGPTSQPTEPPGGSPGEPPADTPPPAAPDPGAGGQACPYSVDTSFAQQLVAIINQARQQAGLNTLNAQGQLTAAAQVHSIDIACTDSYDHIGSDGSVWTERVARQGYANFNSARENIRVGNPDFGFTPQYVFDRWFESQIHHDNMYYPSLKEIGLSCVFNPNSEYKEFCTAVFARP